MYLCCITSDIMYNVHCAYYVLCIDCKDTQANHTNMYLSQTKTTYILLYVSHRYLYTIILGSLKLGNILERKTYIIQTENRREEIFPPTSPLFSRLQPIELSKYIYAYPSNDLLIYCTNSQMFHSYKLNFYDEHTNIIEF